MAVRREPTAENGLKTMTEAEAKAAIATQFERAGTFVGRLEEVIRLVRDEGASAASAIEGLARELIRDELAQQNAADLAEAVVCRNGPPDA